MPVAPVPFNAVAAQIKEIRISAIFRYKNMFARTLHMIFFEKDLQIEKFGTPANCFNFSSGKCNFPLLIFLLST